MKYMTANPYEAEKLIERVKKSIAEKRNVEYHDILPPRTNKQNAYLHAIIGGFAVFTGFTFNDVKYKLIKGRICRDMFYKGTRKNILGEVEDVFRSVCTLDVKEIGEVITTFRNYTAMQGFYIPDPEEYKEAENFRVFCEKQMELNKEFLYM